VGVSTLIESLSSRPYSQSRLGSLGAPQSVIALLLLTLATIAADQFFAPALYTTSPLWGTLACLLLVWRRGGAPTEQTIWARLSLARFFLFFAAHFAIVLASTWLHSRSSAMLPSLAANGWPVAALKLTVFAPTLLLLPIPSWKCLARAYVPELLAALVVLVTFFPTRLMESAWPWYGQILGRIVYAFAHLFVPGVSYYPALTPTISGPDLDLTILYSCSGMSGLELFDILFGFVVFLDWRRLAKKRALMAYFAGIAVMLLSNALRITSLFVFGNRGFADSVSQFHISAGWIFFTLLFLVYLALTYGWMIGARQNLPTESGELKEIPSFNNAGINGIPQ
jgi:exosortase/archaeosortase family protein